MKQNVFIIGLVPLAWLVFMWLAYPAADRLVILALLPAVWLQALGGDWLEHSMRVLLVSAFGAMTVVGLILYGLRLSIRAAVFISLGMALLLWGFVLYVTRQGTLIRHPEAVIAWFFSCWSLALFLLPGPALIVRLASAIRERATPPLIKTD